MFRKLLTIIAINSVMLIVVTSAFGKSKRDWTPVQNLVDQEVAVKTSGGKMKYGIVKSVDGNGVVLKVADRKRLTTDEQNICKDDVKKNWRALLFVNDRQTGKGALIGTSVGTLAGGVVFVANRDDALSGFAVPLFMVKGAIIVGAAGFFFQEETQKPRFSL